MTNSADLPNNKPEEQPQANSPENSSAEIQPAQPAQALDQAPPEEVQEVGREAMKTMAAEIREMREMPTKPSRILGADEPTGELQTKATQQLNNIPFECLIGGPLTAAVKAQGLAAKETATFIQEVGFVLDEKGNATLRTVEFQYSRLTKNAKDETDTEDVTIKVPLLTLVPIPFIRINDMNINFKAKINANSKVESSEKSSTEKNAKLTGGVSYWFYKVNFEGGISSKSDSTASRHSDYSVEYTMDVNVHATQDSMPAGLQVVLNKLTDSIHEKSST
jgi:hypothetical protein